MDIEEKYKNVLEYINSNSMPLFVEDYIEDIYLELKKKDKVINEMAKEIADITGSCPLDKYDYGLDCEEKCKHDRETECWKEYFTNKAENVGE